MTEDLRRTVRRLLPGVLADLGALIRIPSVGAEPAAAPYLRQCAEATAELFRAAGAHRADLVHTGAQDRPAVLAHFPGPPDQPTVLLYGHYDVVPPGDPAAWTSPPFEPVVRDGRLHGRGSADNKAAIAAHLAALRAHRGSPPVTVTVLIEGEQETGSTTLRPLLEQYRDQLTADLLVLADGSNWEIGVPALTTTMRGLVTCDVEVSVLRHSIAGGYAGPVPDALTALCRLLATLHDDKGDVAIAGLVTARSPQAELPEDVLRPEVGLLDGVQLIGSGTVTERLWAKPAATVTSIAPPPAAHTPGALTPAARARIALRLAPGDSPAQAMRALAGHLTANAPWNVHVVVTDGQATRPCALATDTPALDALRAAFRHAYGQEVVDAGVGSTIPYALAFADAYPAAAIAVTSPGTDPGCRAHSTDEGLHLGDFARACTAEALLLTELARPREGRP